MVEVDSTSRVENLKKLMDCVCSFLVEPIYKIEVQNTPSIISSLLNIECFNSNSNKLGLSKNCFKDYSERLKNRKLTSKLKQSGNIDRPYNSSSEIEIALSVIDKLNLIKNVYFKKFKNLNYQVDSTDFKRIHCIRLDDSCLIHIYNYKEIKLVTRKITINPRLNILFNSYDLPQTLYDKLAYIMTLEDDKLKSCFTLNNCTSILSISQLEKLLSVPRTFHKKEDSHNLDINKNQSNTHTDEYDLYDDHKLKQSSILKNSLVHEEDKAKNLFDDFSGSEIQGIDYSDLD